MLSVVLCLEQIEPIEKTGEYGVVKLTLTKKIYMFLFLNLVKQQILMQH